MPKDHEVSAHALELAVAGRRLEPVLPWRRLIAPRGWKTAQGPGSANIPKEATTAWVYYASPGQELVDAVDRMLEYYSLSRRLWWLAEPESSIYAAKIETCDAACVLLGELVGAPDLVAAARRQLRESAERSVLMLAELRDDFLAANPKASEEDIAQYRRALERNLGGAIVCRAGARSWGHTLHVESPMTSVARLALNLPGPKPKPRGRVGDVDGSNITGRLVARLLPIFREAFQDAARMSVAELVASAERSWAPARGPFQYIGWRDGSRLCVTGRDEDGFVDEDTNGNTPGILSFGVLEGRMVALPEWPAPNSGANHLRQTNTLGDVDLASDFGSLELLHSHFGRERARVGGRDLWRTRLELPPARERLFHLISEPGRPWRSLLGAPAPGPAPGPGPTLPAPGPGPDPRPAPPESERGSWIDRLLASLKALWGRLRGREES